MGNDCCFVGGYFLVGSECSGLEVVLVDFFVGCMMVIMLGLDMFLFVVEFVELFWYGFGVKIMWMLFSDYDELMLMMSYLFYIVVVLIVFLIFFELVLYVLIGWLDIICVVGGNV